MGFVHLILKIYNIKIRNVWREERFNVPEKGDTHQQLCVCNSSMCFDLFLFLLNVCKPYLDGKKGQHLSRLKLNNNNFEWN